MQAAGARTVPELPALWPELWASDVVRSSARFVFQTRRGAGVATPACLRLSAQEEARAAAADDRRLVEDAVASAREARSHTEVHRALSLLRQVGLRRP